MADLLFSHFAAGAGTRPRRPARRLTRTLGPRALARTLARALALAACLAIPAAGATAEDAASSDLTVIELFTSQGCYSCPPAEAFLGELAERADLVALEFHVDYWDDLVYGAAGQWKDPFSDPAYTRRQQLYAKVIPGGRVYTPQMVIDGRLETVGSQRGAVLERIERARRERVEPPRLAVARRGGSLTVTLDGVAAQPLELWLVSFRQDEVTEVKSGENKGKTLASHHIVTGLEPLGAWSGGPLSLPVEASAETEGLGCAILVQEPRQGAILAARYCPQAPGA